MIPAQQSRFAYVTYIRATPQNIWNVLRGNAASWHGRSIVCDWEGGAPWKMVYRDGRVTDDGEILEYDAPHRMVIRWRHQLSSRVKAEGPTRCTIELDPLGGGGLDGLGPRWPGMRAALRYFPQPAPGAVKVTIAHEADVPSSRFIVAISRVWPRVLSNIKSILERGDIAVVEDRRRWVRLPTGERLSYGPRSGARRATGNPPMENPTSAPPGSAFTYTTFICTRSEKLWNALTDPKLIRSYWFNSTAECDWKKGSPWKLVGADGRVTDRGEILETDPPRRIVIRWQNEWNPELKAEGPGRCTMEIEPVSSAAVKLTVAHEMDRPDSKLIAAVSGGWPQVLSNLKSILETGDVAITEAEHRGGQSGRLETLPS